MEKTAKKLAFMESRPRARKIKLREYPYTYARVSVMKSKLIRKESYNKLLKMGISEIAKFLQDTEYKREIDELGIKKSGVPLIESALSLNMVRTFIKLKRIAEDQGLRQVIDLYMIRRDIWNIKAILRGKHSSQNEEEIRDLLVPVGMLGEHMLNELIKKESIGDVIKAINFMPFDNLRRTFAAYKEKKSLFELENALDHDYYSYLIEFSKRLPKEGRLFREFIENEIDIHNIKMLLRLKRERIQKKDIQQYLFYPGAKLSRPELARLADADDIQSIMKMLPKMGVRHFFRESEKKEDLTEIELGLNRYLLDRAILLIHQNPLSVDVILGYMFAKEIEIRNLRTIIKGKQLGMGESFIEKELVIGG